MLGRHPLLERYSSVLALAEISDSQCAFDAIGIPVIAIERTHETVPHVFELVAIGLCEQ